MEINISKSVARRFLLTKQLLFPPQSLTGQNGIASVFEALRAIQYDPQNPCGRNVDLVLQARVKEIHPIDYHLWLYEQKRGIECYDKELCVVPLADLTLCRYMKIKKDRWDKRDAFLLKHQAELIEVIKLVRNHDDLSAKDIKDSRFVNLFWEQSRWGKAALDCLWKNGDLVISRRKGNIKYYNLPEKQYGTEFSWNIKTAELTIEQILRRLRSVGILPKNGTGGGWFGIDYGKDIAPLIELLIGQGKLIEIKVDLVKRSFVINQKDLSLLNRLEDNHQINTQMVFLAPLDNLLWDRKLVKELFDFEYTWEAYTPLAKRRYGHYVLPILYGEDFIGRIEPVVQNRILKINGLWLENKVKPTNRLQKALDLCLIRFGKYLNATEISSQFLK